MKLKIDGDINQSYVQNLCLMFFPCEKFSESEEETDETEDNEETSCDTEV